MNVRLDQESELAVTESEELRYILFDVGAIRLATPLLSVREIVEPIPYQSVLGPYPSFLGLANLRGQIIGVIDFGRCLKMDPVDGVAGSKLIIFDGEETKLGILVTNVHSSLVIPSDEIIQETLTEAVIPNEALLGIAKLDHQIIPIVSLAILAKSLSHSASGQV